MEEAGAAAVNGVLYVIGGSVTFDGVTGVVYGAVYALTG